MRTHDKVSSRTSFTRKLNHRNRSHIPEIDSAPEIAHITRYRTTYYQVIVVYMPLLPIINDYLPPTPRFFFSAKVYAILLE